MQHKINLNAAYWNLTGSPNSLSFLPTELCRPPQPLRTHLRLPGAAAHLQVIGKELHTSTSYKADRLLLMRGCFDETGVWRIHAHKRPICRVKWQIVAWSRRNGRRKLPAAASRNSLVSWDLVSKARNVRAWNRNRRCPKRTDTGLLCADGLQKESFPSAHGGFVCFCCSYFWTEHGNIISPINGLFCYHAVQIWTVSKTIPDQ